MNDGATWLWVMPSSSARLAQLPRAIDKVWFQFHVFFLFFNFLFHEFFLLRLQKVPFFEALKKFRDYLNGHLAKVDDCEVTFSSVVLKNWAKVSSQLFVYIFCLHFLFTFCLFTNFRAVSTLSKLKNPMKKMKMPPKNNLYLKVLRSIYILFIVIFCTFLYMFF